MGIDPSTQRERMVEAIEVILKLFAGERVTHKADWFTLVDATCQLRPYTWPHPEICGRVERDAIGRQARGQAWLRHAVRGGDTGGRLRRARHQLEDRERDGAADTAERWIRKRCALSGRCISRRRARKRSRTSNSASSSGRIISPASPASPGAKAPNNQSPEELGQAGRDRGRHARRCHRADPPAAGQAGRVRLLPAARAQLGEFRSDQEILRSVAAPCDAGRSTRPTSPAKRPTIGRATTSERFIGAAMNAAMQTIQKHHEDEAKKASEGGGIATPPLSLSPTTPGYSSAALCDPRVAHSTAHKCIISLGWERGEMQSDQRLR